jgi:hypothetical protein
MSQGGRGDNVTISALESLLREGGDRAAAPVESWNPPYCGDIGLRIAADGTWLYQESPITRTPLIKLFAGVLRKDADGRTYLVTPAEKVDVRVDDAPFLAVEMAVSGEGSSQRLAFRTNVDDVVEAGAAHPLRFCEQDGGGLKPYVHVRGRLEALVTRAVYLDLVELAVEGEDGTIGVWSSGVFFPLQNSPTGA